MQLGNDILCVEGGGGQPYIMLRDKKVVAMHVECKLTMNL